MISVSNPKVKLAASLAVRKYRERHGLVLVEGERLIRQSLSFGAQIQYVLSLVDRLPHDLREQLTQAGVETFWAGDDVMRRVCQTQTPQGIVAVAKAASEASVDLTRARRLLVLDQLQDPGNLGTLLRAAVAVEIDGVVLTRGCVDPKNAKAIRASAGAYFKAPLWTGWEPQALAARLRDMGFRIVAADVHGGVDAFAFDWQEKWALVLGNEGSGLDPAIEPTDRVYLPMPGGIESLNVSVAGSILLYEAFRRQRGGHTVL